MTTANPTLSLSTIDGTTRTLDDWTTVFRHCWVVLPSKAEAREIIPVAEQIFKTFGDSDVRCAYLVPGNEEMARRLMEMTTLKTQCFIDPEYKLCDAYSIKQAPSLLYLKQDTSVETLVQGFEIESWTKATAQIAKSLRWIAPQLTKFTNVNKQSYLIK